MNSVYLYLARDERLKQNMISTYGTGNPDAILYLKLGQKLSVKFDKSNLSSCITSSVITANGQDYITFIIKASINFETFCSALVDKEEGEDYDCHHPDIRLKPYFG